MEKLHLSQNEVDYNQLDLLLALEDWQDADLETIRVVHKVAGNKNGWLTHEDIKNFPCKDLHKINELWLHYSHGKFGLSVQIEIYQSLGGTEAFSCEAWCEFSAQVGWPVTGDWTKWEDRTFDLNAPKGHLPSGFARPLHHQFCRCSPLFSWFRWCGPNGDFISRAKLCNLVPYTFSDNASL